VPLNDPVKNTSKRRLTTKEYNRTLHKITYTTAAPKLMQNAGWEIKTFIFLSVIFFISR
jgi:hypothetical protein